MLSKVYIPYKGYFSSPFARWQGSLANENAISMAAETSKRWLAEKKATLHELADEYDVSAERIRQLEKSALNKLKAHIQQAA